MSDQDLKVRTADLPIYAWVRQLLMIWEGESKEAIYTMMKSIWSQTGTPQATLDWTDPDEWIPHRLSDSDSAIATRIWTKSDKLVNPRHLSGSYQFINRYDLLVPDSDGIYRITDRGRSFHNWDQQIIRTIDNTEGIPQLLSILATKTQAKRSDLLPEWGEFLQEHSNYNSKSTFRMTLHRRLANLIERDYIRKEGNTYIITSKGIDYASPNGSPDPSPRRKVLKTLTDYNQKQRKALKENLGKMHPYRFEHLVRDLLEVMGYEDVEVTRESGDKGVDVVATVQFGITTITEVVQVKRHKGSITRPVLDQLRGSLPYHKAIRGTIITTGKFSKGCKEAALYPGAAPIGLIDGEKLLDLLIEHEIGLRKRPAQLYELDESVFEEPEDTVGEPEVE